MLANDRIDSSVMEQLGDEERKLTRSSAKGGGSDDTKCFPSRNGNKLYGGLDKVVDSDPKHFTEQVETDPSDIGSRTTPTADDTHSEMEVNSVLIDGTGKKTGTSPMAENPRKRQATDGPPIRHNDGRAKVRKVLGEIGDDDATVTDGNSHQIRDYDFFRQTCALPTPENYPEAATSLFGDDSAWYGFWNSVGVRHNLKAAFSEAKFHTVRQNYVVKYNCLVELITEDNSRHTADGEGWSKRGAKKAALLHLQSKLHLSGVLSKLVLPEPTPEQLNDLKMSKDITSKTEVYNLVARFGFVPKFHTQAGKKRSKRKVTVTISVVALGISATAAGPSLMSAEVGAAVGFKRLIEQKIREAEPEKPFWCLSTQTAQDFFEFYRSTHKGHTVTLYSSPGVPVIRGSDDGDLRRHAAAVSINGYLVGEEVYFESRKKAQAAAYLTAALSVVNQEPYLLNQFQEYSPKAADHRPKPLGHLDLRVEPETLRIMRTASESFHNDWISRARERPLSDELMDWEPQASPRERLSEQYSQRRNTLLQKRQAELDTGGKFVDMNKKKAELPLRQYGSRVLEMVNKNQYSIVVGAPGCGKTTQVPQLLLEQAIASGEGTSCNIICTQPRRIAAKSVARRVAQERGEFLQNTVGYQVRFDSKPPIPGGSINYCTTGILLAQLEKDGDAALDGLSHIILDEVHERDMLIDFLMVVLKKSVAARRQAKQSCPKVILMSATVDTKLFSDYLQNISIFGSRSPCPSISVPGRLYPVMEHYLDEILADLRETYKSEFDSLMQLDKVNSRFITAEKAFSQNSAQNGGSHCRPTVDQSNSQRIPSNDALISENEAENGLMPIHLIAATLARIVQRSSEGAILVFLPGFEEISRVGRLLQSQKIFGVDFADTSQFKIIMLHSTLHEAQNEVFDPVPSGCRKIVLATNIAETSITIPEVRFIVDTGRMREQRYSQVHRVTRLLTTWESKSNSRQRAGRAGRVQNGHYLGLFTRARYESFDTAGLPEMLRKDLQSLCLSVKVQAKHASIRGFLADALEPPTAEAVDASIKTLQSLQALSGDEELTPLGRVLARLPVHPMLGKMIVLGVIFKCLDPMLIVGAAHDERPLFNRPFEQRQAAEEAQAEYFEATKSDQIALINAFRELRQIRDEQGQISAEIWSRQKYLHFGAFTMIDRSTQQIEDVLVDAGLIPRTHAYEREYSELGGSRLNENAGNVAIVKALLVAGFAPNLAIQMSPSLFKTPSEHKTAIHPGSINSKKKQSQNDLDRGAVFTYANLVKGSDGKLLLLRNTTLATPLMALLFGGRIRVERPGVIRVDDWLSYRIPDDRLAAWDVMQFRSSLDTLLTGAFRDLADLNPDDSRYLADDPLRDSFVRSLTQVLNRDLTYQRAQRIGHAG